MLYTHFVHRQLIIFITKEICMLSKNVHNFNYVFISKENIIKINLVIIEEVVTNSLHFG